MTTVRAAGEEALRTFKALAPGDSMTVDECTAVVEAVQNLILDLHEARGPMRDVDIIDDYTPGENERVRVQSGYTVTVTLPNSVPIVGTSAYDYGFTSTVLSTGGSSDSADGVTWRQPRDGARIEIVGLAGGNVPGVYFFRADTDDWVLATGLSIDSTLPLNARYTSAFGALIAQRLIETWPGVFEPTSSLLRRVARANTTLMLRPGVARDPVVAEYF